MTKQSQSKRAIDRRTALKAVGGAGAVIAGAAATGRVNRAFGQEKTIQFWSSQTSPEQLKAYEQYVASFEAAHPGLKVNVTLSGGADNWAKLTAAFGSGDVPDLVAHLLGYNVISLFGQGLLQSMDDVVNTVGESDFQQNARDIYKIDGTYYSAGCITNNSLSVLWYRTDLLEKAGFSKAPVTWDEMIDVAKKTKKGRVSGMSLPYGKSGMANRMVDITVHQAGGWIVDPDLEPAFNSQATVDALEFLKEVREYCPAGADGYSYGETLNAFVIGRAAMTMYTGRTLVNVANKNPPIADKFTAAPFPYMKGGRPYWICAFDSLFIPKGAKNTAEAKLFAAWLFNKKDYIHFLHATPGHLLPTLNSIAKSDEYNDHELLKQYKPEVATMVETTSKAFNFLKPSDEHPYILKGGEIYGSNVLAESLQRVVVNGESPKAVAALGHDKIAAILKG